MEKESKYIILKLANNGLYYNDSELILWENTNFPSKDNFSFNGLYEVFWKVEMDSFNQKSKELVVTVVDYNPNDTKAFQKQFPKHEIRKIIFKPIDWSGLVKYLNFYSPREFENIIQKKVKPPKKELKQPQIEKQNISRGIDVDFRYPLIKSKFKMGFIEITKKIDNIFLHEKVTFKIPNDNILPEFDYIKPYFAKALKKRKVEVKGKIKIDRIGELQIDCNSKEIEQIDEDFITNVKYLITKKAIKNPRILTIDKSLFTEEDFFDGFEEKDKLGDTLKISEKEILEAVLNFKGIRNKKQLIYLSGKLQSKDERVRFTMNPDFGFVFCVKGSQMNHFIWELLDSHATYIWSFIKDELDINQQYDRIEKTINFIRINGRNEYLRQFDDEVIFNKIMHEKTNSNFIDGFPRWKAKINEKII
ncbi:MAG: hypothetical protein DHS20C18_50330 [Saprospiraceae bacterium]|nr:MAG: hypothetical protein DHS20C18_50330 [Saprospiraceae bacterium]